MHLQEELRMHFFDNMEELWYTKGKNAKAAPCSSLYGLLFYTVPDDYEKKENNNEVNGSGQI